ncbi:uncharacterized protein MONOS_6554 [Monocercomonoides exilis]|uniref:uncharacterized protein n=1 Tax=Monocercomonoides exilis TaxID=2049356 RepID=UPI003559595A|nr:hypothetical protein MONOS_6554 [Monocercomonoides exilis]|eukprot:MONOS_6554.1-p1 / transcript=MONOS_6554.1 / gene=MONOS_6554 / organism=Monocercomonoides_exilis_PA203 / gene_product=unspecified product / transcript_product=unspecified product / location=Mono_scaffold00208:18192-18590(+) / protein_length=133 / sequence_SO=supercontig / SO=protein_coding / is_pseudo=false
MTHILSLNEDMIFVSPMELPEVVARNPKKILVVVAAQQLYLRPAPLVIFVCFTIPEIEKRREEAAVVEYLSLSSFNASVIDPSDASEVVASYASTIAMSDTTPLSSSSPSLVGTLSLSDALVTDESESREKY